MRCPYCLLETEQPHDTQEKCEDAILKLNSERVEDENMRYYKSMYDIQYDYSQRLNDLWKDKERQICDSKYRRESGVQSI